MPTWVFLAWLTNYMYLVSMLVSIPVFVVTWPLPTEENPYCDWDCSPEVKFYMYVAFFILAFVVPMIVISLAYGRIVAQMLASQSNRSNHEFPQLQGWFPFFDSFRIAAFSNFIWAILSFLVDNIICFEGWCGISGLKKNYTGASNCCIWR